MLSSIFTDFYKVIEKDIYGIWVFAAWKESLIESYMGVDGRLVCPTHRTEGDGNGLERQSLSKHCNF